MCDIQTVKLCLIVNGEVIFHGASRYSEENRNSGRNKGFVPLGLRERYKN